MFGFTLLEILKATQLIGLTIITGGTITLGALATPSIFRNLNREEAGLLMVEMFTKFDTWIKSASIMILVAKLIEIFYVRRFDFFLETKVGTEIARVFNTGMFLSTFLVLAIAAVSLHIAFKLSPQIISSYEADSPQFGALHRQSEFLHRVNFLLGLGLLISFA